MGEEVEDEIRKFAKKFAKLVINKGVTRYSGAAAEFYKQVEAIAGIYSEMFKNAFKEFFYEFSDEIFQDSEKSA